MKSLLMVFMLVFMSNSYSQIADLKGCWKSINGNDTIVLKMNEIKSNDNQSQCFKFIQFSTQQQKAELFYMYILNDSVRIVDAYGNQHTQVFVKQMNKKESFNCGSLQFQRITSMEFNRTRRTKKKKVSESINLKDEQLKS